jgi:hypothetical protein
MWLALAGGVLMTVMGGYEYYRLSSLKSKGEKIPGRLVDSRTLNTGKGRTSYQVTLDYKPPKSETTYRKDFFVPESVYVQASEVGEADVTYLPDDPTVSEAGGEIRVDTEPLAIAGGLFVAAGALWYFQRRQLAKVESYVTGVASL